LSLLVGNAQRVEVRGDLFDGRVDLGVRAVAGDVDGPPGEDLTEPVELSRHAEEVDEVGLSSVVRGRVVLECLPQRGTVALEQRGMLTQCPLGPPDEVQDVIDPLGLRLGVPDEGGAQAPVLRVGTLGEVDEVGEGAGFDLGGHGEQRTKPQRRVWVRVRGNRRRAAGVELDMSTARATTVLASLASCLAVGLAACGDAGDEPTASAPASTATPGSVGAGPVLIVMPAGLELGPNPRAPDPSGPGTDDLVAGRLRLVAGCLMLDGPSRRIPVWPTDSTWDPSAAAVVLADGTELPTGAWVEAAGRTDASMSTDPAAGGYGSVAAPQSHADRLIDLLPGLGGCMSQEETDTVAYELHDITVTSRGVSADELSVAADPIRTVATVLSSGSSRPMLCWGAVKESLPPQCGGSRITNWDWTAVDHETQADHRWGQYVVTGTYNADGSEFTLTEPARVASAQDWAALNTTTQVDWSTLCPEPADGWHPSAVTTSPAPTSLPPDPQQIAGIEEVPGYGGSWYDRTLDVENVRIVGDESAHAAAAEAIAGLYADAVCIVDTTYTDSELQAIQHQIDERYSGLGPGPSSFITATWVRTDASAAAVFVQVAAPVPGLEAALHDEFGDAVAIERSYTVLD
jgi:hypothetical protein